MTMVLITRLQIGKGKGTTVYTNKINSADYKQLAMLLLDLEAHGVKVEQAIEELKKLKEKGTWPFG